MDMTIHIDERCGARFVYLPFATMEESYKHAHAHKQLETVPTIQRLHSRENIAP